MIVKNLPSYKTSNLKKIETYKIYIYIKEYLLFYHTIVDGIFFFFFFNKKGFFMKVTLLTLNI